MADISRTALFGKLDELSYRAIESATVFCKMRGNPYVELVHWIHQVLAQPDSDLSIHVEEAVERAWVYSTLMFDASRVRTGHLILGMLKTPALRNALSGISREFLKIKPDDLGDQFNRICAGSPEEKQAGPLHAA